MTITICVPVNKSEANQLIFSESSLSALQTLFANADVLFSIVGQGEFDAHQFDLARRKIEKYRGQAVFKLVEQEHPVRMCWLYWTACQFRPDSDFFLISDHNMIFKKRSYGKFKTDSGNFYLEAIKSIKAEPQIGIVACAGSLGGSQYGFNIKPFVTHNLLSKGRGIVVKNFANGNVFPESSLGIRGGLEEMILGLNCNAHNLRVATKFNCPTLHKDLGKTKPLGNRNRTTEPNEYGLHNLEVAKLGVIKWIKENVREDYEFGGVVLNNQFGC